MCRVGLYNLEPWVENTAMMQVSRFHKDRGDEVSLYSPVFHESYDKVYAFSLFDYTDKCMVRPEMVRGGTGFDVKSRLPPEIEGCDLDYSVFPKCETSYIWFSRGCVRKCPFCAVPEKEGMIHSVAPKNLNPNGKYVTVMDNNFFANPGWREAVERLVLWGQPVDFTSGIDVRLFDDEQGEALRRLRIVRGKTLHIAWDNPRDDVIPQVRKLLEYVKPRNVMCYVLVGYWSTPEEDMRRVMDLWKLGVYSFVMPYDKFDRYQRAFARWVNFKAIFKSIPWEKYHQNPFRTGRGASPSGSPKLSAFR